MGLLFVQWYTGGMLAIDVYMLLNLWVAGVGDGTADFTGPATPRLSQRSMWFDKDADSPVGAAVFTFALAFLMLPRLFAMLQPVNRWLLLNAATMEALRLVLFSLLFSVNEAATPRNTLALAFMGCNVVYYGCTWYSTMCMLSRARQGG